MPFSDSTQVTYSSTTNTLHVANGSKFVDLSLVSWATPLWDYMPGLTPGGPGRSYTSGSFSVRPDGANGTRITYQNDYACLITAKDSNGNLINGSGVVIGPHTVLTASHVLGGQGKVPYSGIDVFVGISAFDGTPHNGAQPVAGPYDIHYNSINVLPGKKIDLPNTERDLAVINFAYTFDKWLELDPAFMPASNGSPVIGAGYPKGGNDEGLQNQIDIRVAKSSNAEVLDYSSGELKEGMSGGPLLAADKVVGIVSNGGQAAKITYSNVQAITQWERADTTPLTGASTQALLKTDGSVASNQGSGAGISGYSTIEIGGPSSESVFFDKDADCGALQLDNSKHYTGTVYNFRENEFLDLRDMPFSSKTSAYFTPDRNDPATGILNVTNLNNGSAANFHIGHTGDPALLRQYMALSFVARDDHLGGTLITYGQPHSDQAPILAPSH
jgi:V8-like Glu-specific endopeptidase